MTSPYEGMTAVLYARVSTDDKDQTTKTQKRELEKWCVQNAVSVIRTFEESESAGSLERPEFDRMMGFIMRERTGMILSWSVSRLSRDTSDFDWIVKTASSLGIIVRTVSDSIQPETPTGELTAYVESWQAKEERRKLRVNTKAGMATRKLMGVHCGRPIAMVLSHHAEKNRPRINEDTKIVDMDTIVEFVNEGYSTAKAAQTLGVGRATFERVLGDEGILEDYQRHARDVKNARSKGLTPKRVESLYPSTEKTDDGGHVQKGTLMGTDITLMGTDGNPE